ncbi:hypothetical protein NQU36_28515, partial [Escherichia coli]|uniref:hypothetical protein n=1 Tax=Escherichia coli TaxID=562 RepID=UPI002119400B
FEVSDFEGWFLGYSSVCDVLAISSIFHSQCFVCNICAEWTLFSCFVGIFLFQRHDPTASFGMLFLAHGAFIFLRIITNAG